MVERLQMYAMDFSAEQSFYLGSVLAVIGVMVSFVFVTLWSIDDNDHNDDDDDDDDDGKAPKEDDGNGKGKGKDADNADGDDDDDGNVGAEDKRSMISTGAITQCKSIVLKPSRTMQELTRLVSSTGRFRTRRSVPFMILAAYLCYMLVFHYLANLPVDEGLLYGVQARFWQQPNVIAFLWVGIGLSWVSIRESRPPCNSALSTLNSRRGPPTPPTPPSPNSPSL